MDQSLTFESSLSACIQVTTTDDNILEDTETVGIALSSSDPDVNMDGLSFATITIMDNDSTWLLSTSSVVHLACTSSKIKCSSLDV